MGNKVAFFSTKGVTVPVGVSAFPGELYHVNCFPKTFARRSVLYAKLSIRSDKLRFVPSAAKE
jgi:hypothetical protein